MTTNRKQTSNIDTSSEGAKSAFVEALLADDRRVVELSPEDVQYAMDVNAAFQRDYLNNEEEKEAFRKQYLRPSR